MNMKLVMLLFLVCSVGQAWSMKSELEGKKEEKTIQHASNPKLVRYSLQYIKMVLDEATEKENEKIDI